VLLKWLPISDKIYSVFFFLFRIGDDVHLRPRTQTDVSASGGGSGGSRLEMDLTEDSASPKNLKKLTAAIKTR
jgi:hypothetical protein